MASDQNKPSFAPRAADNNGDQKSAAYGGHRLRYLLILAGIISLAGVGSLLIWEQNDAVNIQVTAIDADLPSDNKSFRLEGATYKGNTAEGEEYVLFADVATEDAEQKGVITLIAPRAKLDQPDQQSITVRSNEGIYIENAEELTLIGRVVIVQPETGYTLYTDAARAYLDDGILESTDDVQGYGPDSIITAKGMIINRNTSNVVFTGKSQLIIEKEKER